MMNAAIANGTPEPTASLFAGYNETQPDLCPSGGPAHTASLQFGILTDEDATISAYPNPFSSIANIEFEFTSDESRVTVELFNLNGDKVGTLFDSNVKAGVEYKVEVDGDKLRDGIYIYRISTPDRAYHNKIILQK